MFNKEEYTFQITYYLNTKSIIHSKKVTVEADCESEAREIVYDRYNVLSITRIEN